MFTRGMVICGLLLAAGIDPGPGDLATTGNGADRPPVSTKLSDVAANAIDRGRIDGQLVQGTGCPWDCGGELLVDPVLGLGQEIAGGPFAPLRNGDIHAGCAQQPGPHRRAQQQGEEHLARSQHRQPPPVQCSGCENHENIRNHSIWNRTSLSS